jgi:hypothetical protein
VTVADSTAEHDVADGGDGGDLGYRSRRRISEGIAFRISQWMAPADCEHADSRVNSVGRHDAEHVAAGSHLT